MDEKIMSLTPEAFDDMARQIAERNNLDLETAGKYMGILVKMNDCGSTDLGSTKYDNSFRFSIPFIRTLRSVFTARAARFFSGNVRGSAVENAIV